MSLYIGIDLGTTYSAVAYVSPAGTPQIIQTTQDSVTTPSAVYIDASGEFLIGEEAKEEQRSKEQVATFYKRDMAQSNAIYYPENGKAYSAVDLSTIFLRELIKRTEDKMKQKVDGAVITVPAYFTEHEKSNTRKAAEDAGINVLHMVNEPTAAAIAYGLDKSENRNILVYDLGGGTFDISVAHIDYDKIKIIATIGDHQLGGKDWDKEICRWTAKKFAEQFGDDFSCDAEQMDALMVDAEKLKRNLTQRTEAEIKVKYEGNIGKYKLSEKEFRQMTRPILERTGELINTMFKENNMSWNNIDDIILVGGSTRMKMVEDYIKEISSKPALRGINPDEAVALGAALLAKSISDTASKFSLGGEVGFELTVGNKKVEDVNSHSLGLIVSREENIGKDKYRVFYNEIMIPKNTSLEDATMTKRFQLNSDTQDIYLTQWESDSIPEKEAIIGKYQVLNIVKNTPFSVTYFHKPDGTVDITAEQSGRKLQVNKVLDHADRDFEPELIKQPAKGAIMIAIDLSGSMSCIAFDKNGKSKELDELLAHIKSNTASAEEERQFELLQNYFNLYEEYEKKNNFNAYKKSEEVASEIWITAIGTTKRFIHDFIGKFPLQNVSFGIVGFADRIKSFCSLSNDEESIRNAVDNLAITDATGECNAAQPMDYMFDLLSAKKRNENLDFVYAVVLTDGYWDDAATKAALAAKPKYMREGIEIIAQGFGDAKEDFIRNLATVEDLSGVGDLSELGESMSNIAQVISDDYSL